MVNLEILDLKSSSKSKIIYIQRPFLPSCAVLNLVIYNSVFIAVLGIEDLREREMIYIQM